MPKERCNSHLFALFVLHLLYCAGGGGEVQGVRVPPCGRSWMRLYGWEGRVWVYIGKNESPMTTHR
ncbi:hypothetical protein E2C01_078685 [Portunus trituberculatus]|uniref:Secreted protein n=1 Tax=Portunus trituberculatus TaxID=210409 RepID=A0A5B7IJG2_PORTR|nr:hypothetical protein [Portunus trituberculatus]